MRVIYLSIARLPTKKAHGYQIMKMCEAFANQGAEVTLIYPRRYQTGPLPGNGDLCDYYGLNRKFTVKTIPALDLREWLPGLWFLLHAVVHALVTFLYTTRWWRCPNVTFYTRDPFSIALLLVFRPFIKPCLVYETHVFSGSSQSRLFPLFRRLDLVVAITKQLKQRFMDIGVPEQKIVVAPDAVDLNQFQIADSREECRKRVGLPLDRPVIGYIGRFHAMGMEKGIPELIGAMKYLIANFTENPPLLLCVGGPLDHVTFYERLANQQGVSLEHLRFVDWVPNSEVPFWMRACNVCTIPWSWNEFSAYYTSPMKLFEYMAVGTPIIASNLPSLREVLRDGENALLVKPGNPRALAAGILCLLENPALADQIARTAQSEIVQYTWNARAKCILTRIVSSV